MSIAHPYSFYRKKLKSFLQNNEEGVTQVVLQRVTQVVSKKRKKSVGKPS